MYLRSGKCVSGWRVTRLIMKAHPVEGGGERPEAGNENLESGFQEALYH